MYIYPPIYPSIYMYTMTTTTTHAFSQKGKEVEREKKYERIGLQRYGSQNPISSLFSSTLSSFSISSTKRKKERGRRKEIPQGYQRVSKGVFDYPYKTTPLSLSLSG